MKRLFIPFLLLIIGPPLARAQVLLNLQLPPTGIQLKSQLWNFNITRTTAQPINVKIEMTFTDAGNGQRVMTASSGIVTLTQSLTQLQAGSLAPIAYSVVNNAYNVDMSPNGFLPIGRFDVCFAVLEVGVDASDKLAEECETIEVEPISPPILIQPVDGEQTDIGRPFFTWLPPAPVAAFNQLRYDWLLVQVVGNQTPAEAILQNMPLHAQQNLGSLSLQYPPSLPPLDTGKTYAWQVSAKSTGNAIVKSEVFMFTVKRLMDDMLARRRRTPIYVPLLRENEGVYSKVYDTIRFEYLNDGPDTLATISIQDITSAQRSILLPLGTVQRLNFGFNYLSLGVQTLEGIQDQHIYLLELVNSKKERWYLKFAYSKGNE